MTLTFRDDMTVQLHSHMGGDDAIIQAMLVSTQGADAIDAEATPGRINFLMANRHGTPFEHSSMTFCIEAPIFVFREFHRHRIGWSYNEMSGRYRELPPTFYIPNSIRPLVQEGKPGAYRFVTGSAEQYETTVRRIQQSCAQAYATYQSMLDGGIAKEVARVVLPVGTYSAMFATCNPRSLMAFLSLRTRREPYFREWNAPDEWRNAGLPEKAYSTNPGGSKFPSYPQREIEMVAEQLEEHFARLFPLTYEAFCKNGRVAP